MRHALCVMMMLMTASASAESIIGWRTDWTGHYPDATPPLQWSNDENVVWSTSTPDTSNATPVVVGDRIFITAEPFTLLCLNAPDGKVLWQADNSLLATLEPDQAAAIQDQLKQADARFREAQTAQNELRQISRRLRRDGDNPELKKQHDELEAKVREIETELAPLRDYRPPVTHNANGYASPTPVSDGKHVFVHYGNGVAAAYDLQGKRLWAKLVQRPEHQWGQCSSPTLTSDGETVIIYVRDIFGLDARTGDIRWTAKSEHRWGSPVVTRIGDTDIVLSPNGEVVRASDGHTLATEIARLEYATPVIHDGIAYFIENNSRAVKLPASAAEPFQVQTLWNAQVEGDRHYASPIIHDGLIYTVSRKENFTVLEADTGKKLYERQMQLGGNMPNSAYPSVTRAGDYLFVSSESGATAVLKPGRDYEEVGRNKSSGFRGSPVFVGDRLYLRCFDALRCIADTRTVRAE